jgi:hypothetical protein
MVGNPQLESNTTFLGAYLTLFVDFLYLVGSEQFKSGCVGCLEGLVLRRGRRRRESLKRQVVWY